MLTGTHIAYLGGCATLGLIFQADYRWFVVSFAVAVLLMLISGSYPVVQSGGRSHRHGFTRLRMNDGPYHFSHQQVLSLARVRHKDVGRSPRDAAAVTAPGSFSVLRSSYAG